MGVLVYVLGRTGTGKSYSMRNFPKDKLAVVNVESKILPFRGSGEIETTNTDDSSKILKSLDIYSKDYKSIVVDDFQYVMANEFMRRAYENGWDKFTEIGRHAWEVANHVKQLPDDVIVYVLCHTDTDQEGTERLKTIGKLLDEKIYLEGMSTIVLKTVVSDGKYSFVTQNNGKDTVKSPADMFPSYAIDNDLYYVDQKIREYYGLGNEIAKEDLDAMDSEVSHNDVKKPEPKKRRGRARSEELETTEKAETTPKRRRRSENPEVIATEQRNKEAIEQAVEEVQKNGEEVDFEDFNMPELEKTPKRKRRKKSEESETPEPDPKSEIEAEPEEVVEDAPKPRRRRRRL